MKPLVSIGVPVFNGEKYIGTALESLLAQTYENIEIIVSDNGSTDETLAICRRYSDDSRVRVVHHAQNGGATFNFEYVLQEARGEYFMWAAFDDIYLPGFVELCVSRVESNASWSFSYSSLVFIDEQGEVSESFSSAYDNPDLSASSTLCRAYSWWKQPGWYVIYALFKTDVVRNIPLREAYGADVIFIAELLLAGNRGAKVEETLFQYRQFRGKTEQDRYESAVVDHKPLANMKADLFFSLAGVIVASKLSRLTKLGLALILFYTWSDKLRRSYPGILLHYIRERNYRAGLLLLCLSPFLLVHYVRRLLFAGVNRRPSV